MNTALRIDSEFTSMCPPLIEEEYAQLEENILTEGVIYTPLIVWNGIVVDGHNRYQIACAHPEISFQTYEKQFENRYDALSWICKNQLGRRNLTPQQKMYLIGQRYEAEKKAHGGTHDTKPSDNSCHSEDESRTRKKLAAEVGISEGSVQNAHSYAKGVDAAEKVLPGIKSELLSGSIRPSAKEVAAVAKAAPEDRRQRAEELRIQKERLKQARAASRKEIAEIRAINESMRNDIHKAGDVAALDTLHGAVIEMIRVCGNIFDDFPRLLSDDACKKKVYEIMQEPKQYIQKIESECGMDNRSQTS